MLTRSLRSALGAVAAIFAACSGLTPSLAAQTVSVAKVTFGADSVTAGTAVASTPKCYNSSLAVITCPSARTWFTTNPAVALVSTTGSVSTLAQGRVKIGVCFTNRVCPARELSVGPLVVVTPPPTTTVPSAPGTPQFAIATAGSSTSTVRMTWFPGVNATSYRYTSGLNTSGTWSGQSGSVTTTNVLLLNVPNGASMWGCSQSWNGADSSARACNAFQVPGGGIIVQPPPADTTPTPLPVDTGSTPGSHEPTGMTRITERSFSAISEDGWLGSATATVSLATDALAPKSPSSVAQILFPVKCGGVGASCEPGAFERNLGGTAGTLYISHWVKFSANWDGHLTGVNKILHLWTGGINRFYTYADGGGTTEPLYASVGVQGIVNYNGSNAFRPNLVPTAQYIRGRWHHVEYVLIGNTSGAANGSITWWLDGVKVGEKLSVQFLSGASRWEVIKWDPTWGGQGDVIQVDQTMQMDHIYISGKP